MSYRVEESTGDIIISGFDKGIGESPYAGLTDAKSVNIGSVPGEASVNFATQLVTSAATYATLTATAFGDGQTVTVTGLNNNSFVEQNQAISVTSSSISGLTTGTLYYVQLAVKDTPTQERMKFTLAYGSSAVATIGTTGTAAIATIDVARPKFHANSNLGDSGSNFVLDSAGRVWSDAVLTTGGTDITATSSWTYTGNTVFSGQNGEASSGNGLVYWRTANATKTGDWDGWLFVFRDGFIDYSNVNGVVNATAQSNLGTYVYGWNPATGTTAVATAYLTGRQISACPHNAIVGPDGNLYFCDYFTMKKIQQTNIVAPVTFSPTNTASYIYTDAHNLPTSELATCITPLGDNFFIGGRGYQGYVWNGVDQLTYTNAILFAEPYIYNAVGVNTNVYAQVGNRGNIYITNGAQANVWKKVPDHLSGTVEPYFSWGGLTYQKGKLYFSAYVSDNAQTAVSGYGGVWGVDLTSEAMWLSNQLSYGSYSGYASMIAAVPPSLNLPTGLPNQPAGTGLIVGWVNGASYGIDTSKVAPYTGGQSYVISDAIPIGTLLKPKIGHQFEYKLATPLLSTETVQLSVATTLSDALSGTFTSAGTTSGSTTATILSDNFASPVDPSQWIFVKATLTSRASSPSYNRLTEIRITEGVK
jgi:hypothetical protein